jgi:hypothetical protein
MILTISFDDTECCLGSCKQNCFILINGLIRHFSGNYGAPRADQGSSSVLPESLQILVSPFKYCVSRSFSKIRGILTGENILLTFQT